ncbi:MAG: hypothetical protein NTX65_13895 [Ignavibacteriales bacterium]|nr:hypothetical protein [Ignavibacteriales bacterium]
MSNVTDEILNKYIDGELDSSEVEMVKNEMEKDAKLIAKLQALRMVDNSLHQMEVEHTSGNFTDNVMKAIAAAKKAVKPSVNYFFITIISIFSLGVVAVLIAAFQAYKKNNSPSAIAPYADKAKELFNQNLTALQSIFSNPSVILVISVLSLVLLVTAYFTFESHKNFTKKLNSISH